ncbi:MAG TPA: hypothetical protein VHQ20_02290 [Patescibacteria group bacterium]|jgi:hypothetical protein|nr:hypothetical protein [Patescibacteria group bacterium]
MKKFWLQIKDLASRAWNGLTVVGRVTVGVIILGSLIIGAVSYHQKHPSDKDSNPEVAQIYEPSIGEPLAPDVQPEQKAQVNGAVVTATVPDPNAPAYTPPTTSTTTETTEKKIAPKTGVNQTAPVMFAGLITFAFLVYRKRQLIFNINI